MKVTKIWLGIMVNVVNEVVVTGKVSNGYRQVMQVSVKTKGGVLCTRGDNDID